MAFAAAGNLHTFGQYLQQQGVHLERRKEQQQIGQGKGEGDKHQEEGVSPGYGQVFEGRRGKDTQREAQGQVRAEADGAEQDQGCRPGDGHGNANRRGFGLPRGGCPPGGVNAGCGQQKYNDARNPYSQLT